MLNQSGFRSIIQALVHVLLILDQHFFRLRLVFLGYIKEQLPQSVIRVHSPECIHRKIERKEILCAAVYALGNGGNIRHNRHNLVLLAVQLYRITNRISRLCFFLTVLCTGSRFHHYIAPGQEFLFVKGAIQYPAVLCKGVQNQAVNAV